MKDLESEEKIAIDIAKLERNLKQVEDIKFEGKEKEVFDRAIDYWNDSKYYLEKKDTRTAFGCIEYSHGLLDALRMIILMLGALIAAIFHSNIIFTYFIYILVILSYFTVGQRIFHVWKELNGPKKYRQKRLR